MKMVARWEGMLRINSVATEYATKAPHGLQALACALMPPTLPASTKSQPACHMGGLNQKIIMFREHLVACIQAQSAHIKNCGVFALPEATEESGRISSMPTLSACAVSDTLASVSGKIATRNKIATKIGNCSTEALSF